MSSVIMLITRGCKVITCKPDIRHKYKRINAKENKCNIEFLTKYVTNVLSITEAVMWQVAPAYVTILEVATAIAQLISRSRNSSAAVSTRSMVSICTVVTIIVSNTRKTRSLVVARCSVSVKFHGKWCTTGKDKSDSSNYRPIALTSCICKIMERMINNRLVWYLERNNFITPVQSGFRKQRSTTDHLVRLESFVREAFVQQHAVAIFFDLE